MSSAIENVKNSVEAADIGSRLPDGIRQQLMNFYQLRRSDRIQRGVSGCFIISTLALLAGVLLDACWTSPSARPLASCLFYGVAIVAAWFMVLRPWMRQNLDWLAEARLLQQRSGRLRNILVSAVELASMPLPPGTSQAFTTRVQDDAEEAISSLDVRDVVSRRPRHRAIRRVQVTCGLLAIGCLLPWIQLPSRIGRILLPVANLGRSSWITIQVTQPLPHSKTIAQGDIVVVQAQFSGPWHGRASLETRTDETAESSDMVEIDASNSAKASAAKATISTDQDWVEYRITSQNAATPWYRLDAVPRPRVDRVVATVRSAGTISEGFTTELVPGEPLQVLRGSRIALQATSKSPLAVAEIQWQQARAAAGAPQEPDNKPINLINKSGELSAEFVAQQSRRFTIHLVDSSTAFSNAFPSIFEIDAIDDSPAALTWVTPKTTDHLVAPDELIELSLIVADQLPLRSTSIQYRVNKSDWKPLTNVAHEKEIDGEQLGAQETLSANIDLPLLGARYGDLVEFEGRATDAAANQSTSRTLRMTVVAERTQPLLGPAEQVQFEVADRIDQFADKLTAYVDGPARQSLRSQELVTGFQNDLQQLIAFTLSAAGDLDAPELREAIGLVGSSLTHSNAHLAIHLLRLQSATVDSPSARVDIKRQPDDLRAMAKDLREVLAIRVCRSIADAIAQLASAQDEIAQRATLLAGADSESEVGEGPNVLSLARMQRAVFYQVENTQLIIADAASKLPSSSTARLAQIASSLEAAASGVRREVGNANLRSLQHNASALNDFLGSFSTAQAIFPDWTGRLNRHLGQLAKRAASPSAALGLARSIANSGDRSHEHLCDAFSLNFQVQRGFRRTTHPGDGPLASDLGLAHRAAIAQSNWLTGQPLADRFKQIHAAAAVLMASSFAEQSRSNFEALGYLPRSAQNAASQRTVRSDSGLLRWCLSAGTMPAAADAFNASGYSHALAQRLIQLTGRMQDGMLQRYLAPRRPASSTDSNSFATARTRFRAIAKELDEIQLPLKQKATQARDLLRSLAPSVVDLAKSAAEQTRQLGLMTGDLAGATERDTAASVQTEIQQLAGELSRPADATEMLRDALVDLAESQDLLDTRQIETAKQADNAREQVEVAAEQLNHSLDDIDNSRPDTELAQQLRAAAEKQAAASERLERVAEQLAKAFPELQMAERGGSDPSLASNSSLQPGDSQQPSESPSQQTDGQTSTKQQSGQQPSRQQSSSQPSRGDSPTGQRAAGDQEPGDAQADEEDSDAYEAAEQLAEFADQSPEEMLAALENYLPTSSPMQRELSSIARRAAAEALEQTRVAETRFSQLSTEFRLSDPTAEIASQEIFFDATYANMILREIGIHLLDQSRAAMALAKDDASAQSLNDLKKKLSVPLENWRRRMADIRNSQEASEALLPQNLKRSIDEHLAMSEQLIEIAERQLELTEALRNKSVHSQQRDQKKAAQDASDRLRRTTQLLARVTRGHQRQRKQQLQQIERRASSLAADIKRREALAPKSAMANEQQISRWQAQQRELLRDVERLKQLERLVARMQGKVEAASEQVAASNTIEPLEPDATNPAAQLADRLLGELRRTSRYVADQLSQHGTPPDSFSIAEATVRQSQSVPAEIGSQLSWAAESLDRAARHEQRLGNTQQAQQLAQLATAAERVGSRSNAEVAGTLESALAAASTTTGAIPAELSDSALGEIDVVVDQTRQLVNQLTRFLDGPPVEPQTKPSVAKPPVSMQPDDLANLLDQLDRQLNQGSQLGESDNDSDAANSAASAKPQQLSQSASQIAQALAKGRQSPSEQTSGDLATATESQQADVRPQGPTAVQMLNVERINGNWGQLRERTNEDALEDARLGVPAQYRSQVDAYFRRLGSSASKEANDAP
ncbi:MAG: hypothetical protein Aurels2KO_02500 [Aureliella sp.]